MLRHCWSLAGLLLACLLAGLCGCGGPHESADGKSGEAGKGESQQPAHDDRAAGAEEWQLILFRAPGATKPAKIGYARLTTRTLQENSQEIIKRTLRTELSVKRGASATSQWMEFTSFERPDGQVVRFKTISSMGSGTTMVRGRVTAKQLDLETVVTAGSSRPRREKSSRAWEAKTRGFFGITDVLQAKPLKEAGEKIQFSYYEPSTGLISKVELTALGHEKVALLDETTKALHVRRFEVMGKTEFESHLWCDENGRVLKESVIGTGMEQFLVSKELALSPWSAPEIDFAKAMMIRVREIEKPHETRLSVFRARLRDDVAAAKYFSQCPSQSVTSEKDGAAVITVRRIRPDTNVSATEVRGPTVADLAPNNLIQSDDKNIVNMASQVASAETDAWKLVCALESHVHQSIRLKNFSTAFATAAEVAQTLEGDCTEHAVLLAALCRARKIPARVAVGLVYFVDRTDKKPQMAYHMWTEAFVAERWIPMDATLGLGGIGAAHLKIADSSLAGSSEFSTLLPLMQIANRLQLEVVRTE